MQVLVILYLVGFVRTLLVLIIIYFGIRFISRYVLPLLLDKGVKKMQQKMQDQQRQQRPRRPEGNVTIEKNQNQQSQQNSDKGEYIDFEEVD